MAENLLSVRHPKLNAQKHKMVMVCDHCQYAVPIEVPIRYTNPEVELNFLSQGYASQPSNYCKRCGHWISNRVVDRHVGRFYDLEPKIKKATDYPFRPVHI